MRRCDLFRKDLSHIAVPEDLTRCTELAWGYTVRPRDRTAWVVQMEADSKFPIFIRWLG